MTATRRGLSESVKVGWVRFTRSANGKLYRTIRIPRTGLYNVEEIKRDQ